MQISLLDPNEKSYDHLEAMKARYNIAQPVHLLDKFYDASAATHLRRLVANANARVEDVGQRIFTAMKQKVGADWILYNLAGLYWRVQVAFGNIWSLLHFSVCNISGLVRNLTPRTN